MNIDKTLAEDIDRLVAQMLNEDVGSGDLTAGLLPAGTPGRALVTTREAMTLAGRPWVDALYRRLDAGVSVEWLAADGDQLAGGDTLCRLAGPAQALLSGERAALNILQTLSATATVTRRYAEAIEGTGCRVLDTRKTIPGLRLAQKYAVRCGGGSNHRIGLYDAILIKENHIMAAGGIVEAVALAREQNPGIPVEVEVESLDELSIALGAAPERVLLDNFANGDLKTAVDTRNRTRTDTELEASGNITLDDIRAVAETGVDFISIGALTKHVVAIDLSMRFATDQD